VVRLRDIRKEFPGSGEAINRLEALLNEAKGAGAEYSLEHLYEVIHPDSLGVLAELLTWLTERHYVDRVFRVLSPRSGLGIQDFPSLGEVPDRIFDAIDTESEIDVRDDNIAVLYRLK
jgi:hypothetical protein